MFAFNFEINGRDFKYICLYNTDTILDKIINIVKNELEVINILSKIKLPIHNIKSLSNGKD